MSATAMTAGSGALVAGHPVETINPQHKVADDRMAPERFAELVAEGRPVLEQREASEVRVHKSGLGYEGRYWADRVLFRLERIKQSRGDLVGELTVQYLGDHLYRASFFLGSLSARRSAASYLVTQRKDVDWVKGLERFCLHVLDIEREGEPVTMVGRLPQREGPRYLLDPILPKDAPALLFAPGGTGKSTLATAIAFSVQTGEEVVPGWKPQGCTPVLYLDWEAGEHEVNERISAIAAGKGLPAPAIAYRRCEGRPLTDQVEFLSAYVAENGIGLVVVDSVGLASGTAKEGTDANESALRLFAALRSLKCTTLLVDHVTANDLGNERATAKAYGSIYKMNLARTVFELRREREADGDRAELLLLNTKVNDGPKLRPQGLAIVYDGGAIRFERAVVEAPDLVGTLSAKDQLLRLLGERGALPQATIARELEMNPSTLRVTLHRHVKTFVTLPSGLVGIKA